MIFSRGKLVDTRLVVKRTFLHLEVSSQDDDLEHMSTCGSRARALSDSAIHDFPDIAAFELQEPTKFEALDNKFPWEECEVLTDTGECDTETASNFSDCSSARSACNDQSRSDYSPHCDGNEGTSELRLDSLADANARLLLENKEMKQQCDEFLKSCKQLAQRQVSKADEIAHAQREQSRRTHRECPLLRPPGSMNGGAQQLNHSKESQKTHMERQPLRPPGSMNGGAQQMNPSKELQKTDKERQPLRPPGSMNGGAQQLNDSAHSDGTFNHIDMRLGSCMYVPMLPTAFDKSPNCYASIAQSVINEASKDESLVSLRRGSRIEIPREEQMIEEHTVFKNASLSNVCKSGALGNSLQSKHMSSSRGGKQKPHDIDQQLTCPLFLRTTLMIRNLPNNYTRTMLLELFDSEGFGRSYDFVYAPIDFITTASLGYAFVNLINHAEAKRFQEKFDGFCDWVMPSRKVCSFNWSGPHQGLQAHIERYRNSPLMHEMVPDNCKPAVFADGKRTTFPPPTKKIQAPRINMMRQQVYSSSVQNRDSDSGRPGMDC